MIDYDDVRGFMETTESAELMHSENEMSFRMLETDNIKNLIKL